jgi:hypothetical protein
LYAFLGQGQEHYWLEEIFGDSYVVRHVALLGQKLVRQISVEDHEQNGHDGYLHATAILLKVLYQIGGN